MKKLLLFVLFANSTFATDFLYYCDDAFDNKKTYQDTINEKGDFDLESSKIKLTFNLNSEDASLEIDGKSLALTSAEYDDEMKALVVSRAQGKGAGRHGIGFRFMSQSGCDDKKGTLEQFNIGGVAGGLTTEKMNCVCSVD